MLHAGKPAPRDVDKATGVNSVASVPESCLDPNRYPAGVRSVADPLIEAFARFAARTGFLPRTNPVVEIATDSSASSPLTNGWNPTPAPPRPFTGISATSVTFQPFSDTDSMASPFAQE